MTLRELYAEIGGDYEQAVKVLCIEKLMDKHIRKFSQNAVFAELKDAAAAMDATRLFESAHAIKGLCANLGLVDMAAAAEEICTEFRPGRERKFTDDAVKQKVCLLSDTYARVCDGIRKYEQS